MLTCDDYGKIYIFCSHAISNIKKYLNLWYVEMTHYYNCFKYKLLWDFVSSIILILVFYIKLNLYYEFLHPVTMNKRFFFISHKIHKRTSRDIADIISHTSTIKIQQKNKIKQRRLPKKTKNWSDSRSQYTTLSFLTILTV